MNVAARQTAGQGKLAGILQTSRPGQLAPPPYRMRWRGLGQDPPAGLQHRVFLDCKKRTTCPEKRPEKGRFLGKTRSSPSGIGAV